MNKFIPFALAALLIAASCSKKSSPAPEPHSTSHSYHPSSGYYGGDSVNTHKIPWDE